MLVDPQKKSVTRYYHNNIAKGIVKSSFQWVSVVNPKPKRSFWPIKKNTDDPVSQSKLEVIHACSFTLAFVSALFKSSQLRPGSNAAIHERNRMLMRENKGFFSFAFNSAHVKNGVWPGLNSTSHNVDYSQASDSVKLRRFISVDCFRRNKTAIFQAIHRIFNDC